MNRGFGIALVILMAALFWGCSGGKSGSGGPGGQAGPAAGSGTLAMSVSFAGAARADDAQQQGAAGLPAGTARLRIQVFRDVPPLCLVFFEDRQPGALVQLVELEGLPPGPADVVVTALGPDDRFLAYSVFETDIPDGGQVAEVVDGTNPLVGVEITPSEFNLPFAGGDPNDVGSIVQLSALAHFSGLGPLDVTAAGDWGSTAPDVAEVNNTNAKGLVIGLADGRGTIVVRFDDFQDEVPFTVGAADPNDVGAVVDPAVKPGSVEFVPASPGAGGQFTARFILVNSGERIATPFPVVLEMDGGVVGDVQFPSFPANTEGVCQFPCTAPGAPGPYATRLIIDPENVLDEIDEGNNVFQTTLTVQAD